MSDSENSGAENTSVDPVVIRRDGDGQEIAIVAIRAVRYRGRGTATIYYQGKDEDGKWHPFRKKDNPHTAKIKPTAWKEWRMYKHEGGCRFSSRKVSEEVAV